ncbi:MAG: hypothetical protein HY820_16420 [Acidobacteria bacterium]|nr:hypothetical protein [Acidobacteriota bacterium]
MLQIARLSPKLLGEAAELVANFLRSQQNPDGGFRNRSGDSDLYYTVFGIEGLIALDQKIAAGLVAAYLEPFRNGEQLDLVHLGCLIRCWANIERGPLPLNADTIAAAIEQHHTRDGGYNTALMEEEGTAYGCFVAMAAYQDLRRELPDPDGVLRCLRRMRAEDGGYANQPDLPFGLTPSSAAVATLYRHLGEEAPAELPEWMLSRCHAEGGFYATPVAPIPDLLSTATALHALAGMKASIAAVQEPCLDFIDTLWTNKGGFYGNWTEDTLDCEYNYYGLLALGHLSLPS